MSIIGARPQIIKSVTLSSVISEKFSSEVQEVIIHTGQHYDENMSGRLLKDFSVSPPKYNLDINNVSHGEMTGKMILEIEKVCQLEKPEWMIVYGDTNSTLAAAIVASKLHIKIAHIEAGLRSYKMRMPEEINRVLTDRISTLLFCPTESAIKNLIAEGFKNFSNVYIKNVGDIMYEGVVRFSKNMKKPRLPFEPKKINYVLATIHRAEITSCKKKLLSVLSALNKINESTRVVAPFHPRTVKAIDEFQISVNFDVISPVSYLEMLWLIKNSKLVITDSGGLQKEAFFLKKISLIPREETEWVELLQSSNSKLVGYDKNKIIEEYKKTGNFNPTPNLFGEGNTSEQNINSIINYSKT